MLKFDKQWRFDSPGDISSPVITAFQDFIGIIANQGSRRDTLEHFKSYFASAAGISSSWSSSESWAESDLYDYMQRAAVNAPLFIEAFYDGCESMRKAEPDYAIPDITRINRVLADNRTGYKIEPPHLRSVNASEAIPVPQRAPSLDEQAQELIQQSLKQCERLLSEALGGRQFRKRCGSWKRCLPLSKGWRPRSVQYKESISIKSRKIFASTTKGRCWSRCSPG